MKLSKKLLTVGIIGVTAMLLTGAFIQLNSNKANDQVKAISGCTTYYNSDLGFATRDPNDTRVVLGDVDGGMQTKGVVADAKSELKINFKKTLDNYWIGVGGYAVYVSSSTTVRFLYLGYNSSGQYSRNVEKNNLVMKTRDGSKTLTSQYASGKLFSEYTDAVIRFDLTDLTAVKAQFYVEYNDEYYYPFDGSTRLDEVTYTHQPSGFASGDQYRIMAGAAAADSGISIIKLANQNKHKDLANVISNGTASFNYSYIGDLVIEFPLSEQITSFDGYLNNHLDSWKDENNQSINIGDALLINGETFTFWVNYVETNLVPDSSSSHGIHNFPGYILESGDPVYTPVTFNVNASRIKLVINTAYLPSDSLIITFRADGFRSFYNGTIFSLERDLTFYSTLNTSDYRHPANNIVLVRNLTDTVGQYSITNINDKGSRTAAGGATYEKIVITTDIPRDNTHITDSFPHDHYRYMFENIILNGYTLQYYNVWGRGNGKDYTDLANAVLNTDYELEHPTSGINYNMVTYAKLESGSTYIFTIEIPHKLMNDFGYTTYNISLRDGSAWVTPSGVIRLNENNADNIVVQGFATDYMHLNDVALSNHSDTNACRGNHGYYLTAKKVFNGLTASQKDLFRNSTDTDIANARERYEAWAFANHDAAPYDGNDFINTYTNAMNIMAPLQKEDSVVIIAIISAFVAGATFLFFVLRKRKLAK